MPDFWINPGMTLPSFDRQRNSLLGCRRRGWGLTLPGQEVATGTNFGWVRITGVAVMDLKPGARHGSPPPRKYFEIHLTGIILS
jgi:hypothetical protein